MGLSLSCKPSRFTINRPELQRRVDAGTTAALKVVGAKVADRASRDLRRANPMDKQPRVLFSIESGPTLILQAEESRTPEIMLRSGQKIRSQNASDLRLRLLQRSGRLAGVKRDLAPSDDIALREIVLRRALERAAKSGDLIGAFENTV